MRTTRPNRTVIPIRKPATDDGEALERCEIILEMSRTRDDIEKIALRLFYSTAFPIRKARKINEHLMDAKKSIAAAVAAMPTRSK